MSLDPRRPAPAPAPYVPYTPTYTPAPAPVSSAPATSSGGGGYSYSGTSSWSGGSSGGGVVSYGGGGGGSYGGGGGSSGGGYVYVDPTIAMRSHYVSILKAKTVGLVSSTQEKLLKQVQETYYSQQYQISQSKLFALNNNGFQKNIMLETSLRISGVPSFTAPPIVEQEQKQGTWWEKIIVVPTKLTSFFGGFYKPIATKIHQKNYIEKVSTITQNYDIPKFSEPDEKGFVNVSDSDSYHGGRGGTRRLKESTLLSGEHKLSEAYEKSQELKGLAKHDNLIKSGIKKIGNTIEKAGKSLVVLSIGIEVGTGLSENIKNGESWERIAGDAVGDLFVSGGIELISAKFGAFIGTMLFPGIGTAGGAAIGFLIGEGLSYLASRKDDNGKTYHEKIQDNFTNMFKNINTAPIDKTTGLQLRGSFLM